MVKGRRLGLGQEDGWGAWLKCTQQIKHSSHTSQRKSYLRTQEGLGGWGRMGMEDKTEKQTVPSKDLPLYRRLRWMSGPSSPPFKPTSHVLLTSLCSSRPAVSLILKVGHMLVMWVDVQLQFEKPRSARRKQNSASFMMRPTAAQLCLNGKAIYIYTLCFISLFTSSLLVFTHPLTSCPPSPLTDPALLPPSNGQTGALLP